MKIEKLDELLPNPGFSKIERTEVASVLEEVGVEITSKGEKHTVDRVTFRDAKGNAICAMTTFRNSIGWLRLKSAGSKVLGSFIKGKKGAKADITWPKKKFFIGSDQAFLADGKTPRTVETTRGEQEIFNAYIDGLVWADFKAKV